MSAILKEEPPDLTETNRNVTPALERIVRHCLEKNPAERFQSARDARLQSRSPHRCLQLQPRRSEGAARRKIDSPLGSAPRRGVAPDRVLGRHLSPSPTRTPDRCSRLSRNHFSQWHHSRRPLRARRPDDHLRRLPGTAVRTNFSPRASTAPTRAPSASPTRRFFPSLPAERWPSLCIP